MRPDFLLRSGLQDGRHDRRKRRNRQPHGDAALGQSELKKVLSVFASCYVVTGPERFNLLSSTSRVVWAEKTKFAVYLSFICRTDRQAEEAALYEWGFGTPSNSSLSEYEYFEPAPEPTVSGPLSVQAMRESCRPDFMAWWARRLAKEARHGKPVLRSYPEGEPTDEAIFFDTRDSGEEQKEVGPERNQTWNVL